jgi:hypothetical protein
MSSVPEKKPYAAFRNPMLYTSILLVGAMGYVGWVMAMRRQEARDLEQKSREKQRIEAAQTFEQLGGERFEILNFYAAPGVIRRGDTVQLCYGVSNARTVRLEPPSGEVWPSQARCLNVAPQKTTEYTLTAEDGRGNTRTSSLTVTVH